MPINSVQQNGVVEPEKEEICLFAETNFRNQMLKFGIKTDDRRRHMYVIGKTGMGKTTLLENMVLHDIYAGHGIGVVDPHGDFAEGILDFIPAHRMNDVVYFNPSDADNPIGFNVLEVNSEEQKHLVAAGLMGVFKKIWPDVWSGRMEYILNNVLLALLDSQGATLLGINRMLSDKKYRKRVVGQIKDPVVKKFWIDEYGSWTEKYAIEAGSAIQNKIGQFLSASIIRNMVAQVKSTINVRKIMDSRKIFIMNLSKGRIGEDSSRLLGGMLITQIQLAAMERVDTAEKDRKDFFLYVDEFQNFATPSFANILSEARKYRLSLIMAHQYIAQLDEVVRDAVFGNVGTMVAFRVGAADAEYLEQEFTPTFTQEDIVNLSKFRIFLKLMIDGVASQPFSANTMAPIGNKTGNKEKVVRVSRERYGKSRADIEDKIARWSGMEIQGVVPGADDEDTLDDLGDVDKIAAKKNKVKADDKVLALKELLEKKEGDKVATPKKADQKSDRKNNGANSKSNKTKKAFPHPDEIKKGGTASASQKDSQSSRPGRQQTKPNTDKPRERKGRSDAKTPAPATVTPATPTPAPAAAQPVQAPAPVATPAPASSIVAPAAAISHTPSPAPVAVAPVEPQSTPVVAPVATPTPAPAPVVAPDPAPAAHMVTPVAAPTAVPQPAPEVAPVASVSAPIATPAPAPVPNVVAAPAVAMSHAPTPAPVTVALDPTVEDQQIAPAPTERVAQATPNTPIIATDGTEIPVKKKRKRKRKRKRKSSTNTNGESASSTSIPPAGGQPQHQSFEPIRVQPQPTTPTQPAPVAPPREEVSHSAITPTIVPPAPAPISTPVTETPQVPMPAAVSSAPPAPSAPATPVTPEPAPRERTPGPPKDLTPPAVVASPVVSTPAPVVPVQVAPEPIAPPVQPPAQPIAATTPPPATTPTSPKPIDINTPISFD